MLILSPSSLIGKYVSMETNAAPVFTIAIHAYSTSLQTIYDYSDKFS